MKAMISTMTAAWACTTVSLVCLIAGFGLRGYWAIYFLLPVIPVYWFLTRKVSARITISILFFMYVLLAAAGLFTGVSPYFMLIGCACALAAWESTQFLLNFKHGSAAPADPRLERIHNQDLFLAIGSGLLLGLLGLNIHFQLPFGVIALLAILAIYGLYRGFNSRRRTF